MQLQFAETKEAFRGSNRKHVFAQTAQRHREPQLESLIFILIFNLHGGSFPPGLERVAARSDVQVSQGPSGFGTNRSGFPVTCEQDPEILKLLRLRQQLAPNPGWSGPLIKIVISTICGVDVK